MRGAILAACLIAPLANAAAQTQPPPSATNGTFGTAMERHPRTMLTPEMIGELLKQLDATERAAARVDDPAAHVTPVNRTVRIRLASNEAEPIIHVVKGFITTLSFFDGTGAPWPVVADVNSNPASDGANLTGFHVRRNLEGGNTVEVSGLSTYPRGNIVVHLRGAPSPATFKIDAGRGRYDSKTSVHVAGRGPNASSRVVVRGANVEVGGRHMTEMLEGRTPAGARALRITGASADDVRAWRYGENVYLRTTHLLSAPEPVAYASGERTPEGTLAVYGVPASGPHGTTNFLVMIDGQPKIITAAEH